MLHLTLSVACDMTQIVLKFLNQARTWFLKIDPVRIVGMHVRVCACVCVSAPEAINN